MSDNYDEVRTIARQALLPDFFGVRIDEEKLFPQMQELVARLPGGHPKVDLIKQLAAQASNAEGFIEAIKEHDFWSALRELLTKASVA
jgi:hypothetical protein